MNVCRVDNYHNKKPAFFNTLEDCFISNIIKQNKIWEPHLHELFEIYVNKNSIVLEGGCHIGTHSVKLSMLSKHLICFEPLPISFDKLNQNLILNQCLNYTTHKSGLSDKIEQIAFGWVCPGNPGSSGLLCNPMGNPNWATENQTNVLVEVCTIDSLKLQQLDFIKLDVEGYETRAIQGGIETIKKFKPVIILECWSNHKGEANWEHTYNSFKELINLDYKMQQVSHCDWLFLP